MPGKKDDKDLYDKVDYSLIPLKIITHHLDYRLKRVTGISRRVDYHFFVMIHDILNNRASMSNIHLLFRDVMKQYGIKSLAVSLGVGLSKYKERDNWKKFDSDPDRFLKAALRHLMALMTRVDYDCEEGVEGYDKGNDHRGAVCFALMVVDNIIVNQED